MHVDEALARERVTMAWWGHAIFALALVLVARAALLDHRALDFALLVAVPLVWLVFMTLRTAVTGSHVHVQLGFFGPKIDIGDIEKAEVVRGAAARAGGWGIRFGLSGVVTYSVPRLLGDYLQITYRRGTRLRKVRVMSAEPARLVGAIEAARARTRTPIEARANGAESRTKGPEEHANEAMSPVEEDTGALASSLSPQNSLSPQKRR
jgi:hypothetical protein